MSKIEIYQMLGIIGAAVIFCLGVLIAKGIAGAAAVRTEPPPTPSPKPREHNIDGAGHKRNS